MVRATLGVNSELQLQLLGSGASGGACEQQLQSRRQSATCESAGRRPQPTVRMASTMIAEPSTTPA